MRSANVSSRNDGQTIVYSLPVPLGGSATTPGDPRRSGTAHALQAAEENEQALRQRLHRVHDPKGMELLRGLRDRIAALTGRLQDEENR